jgi:hypothetical protein
MIKSSVDAFPSLSTDANETYDESSQSFPEENLKVYLNKVFEQMKPNIFAFPKILLNIDPTSLPSGFVRMSLAMQDSKVVYLISLRSFFCSFLLLRFVYWPKNWKTLIIKWRIRKGSFETVPFLHEN